MGAESTPTEISVANLIVLVASAPENVQRRFLEFFAAQIRNPNTREAYARAIARFLNWCELIGLNLDSIEPMVVGMYIEEFMTELKPPSVKQHLAAIRTVFDYMVAGGAIPANPAKSFWGPKLRHCTVRVRFPAAPAAADVNLLLFASARLTSPRVAA